ncbi:MAG: SDR family oxidoreductase [Cyanobacteria bacterium J06598_3]
MIWRSQNSPRKNSRPKNNAVKGKTVVLTGASRGIGAEISQLFAQQGANLIGVARDPQRLAGWETDMLSLGIQAKGIVFDLNETEQIGALAEQIKQCAHTFASGQVDILINNAGIEIYRAFQDYRFEEIDRVIRINLLAAMTLTQQLLPVLSSQGHIVNMASLAAKQGHPYDSVYAASKAGLLMWNHSLRQELSGSGQTVSAICPGYVVDCGMLADTGVKAPLFAGRSRSQLIAQAVLKAVLHKRAEIVVNQDPLTVAFTLGLLAAEQFFPRLADVSNRWLGVTQLNQQRIRLAKAHSPKAYSPDSTVPLQ